MIKRILIALALFPALTACPGPLPAPNSIANRTVLDEKVGLAVETAYTGAARALALAIRAGQIRDVAAVEEIRAKARAAVLATRAAYDAGNASSYDSAARQALALIGQINRLTGGQP